MKITQVKSIKIQIFSYISNPFPCGLSNKNPVYNDPIHTTCTLVHIVFT